MLQDGVEILGVTFPQFVTYWFLLFAYAVFALPFCFFNFTNTKYLQMFTIGYRNLAFWTCVLLESLLIDGFLFLNAPLQQRF